MTRKVTEEELDELLGLLRAALRDMASPKGANGLLRRTSVLSKFDKTVELWKPMAVESSDAVASDITKLDARIDQLDAHMLEDIEKGMMQAAAMDRERLNGLKEARNILTSGRRNKD